MKPCDYPQCNNMIEDKYSYCFAHYKSNKSTKTEEPVTQSRPSNMWHDDPIVDQLMKINSNLKRVAEGLDNMVATSKYEANSDARAAIAEHYPKKETPKQPSTRGSYQRKKPMIDTTPEDDDEHEDLFDDNPGAL